MTTDIEKYCRQAVEQGVTEAKPILPSSVVTAAWVRLKCQFGCPGFHLSYCCPPNTPTPEETRKIIDCYQRAILFHIKAPATPERGEVTKNIYNMLIDLEGDIFKDGYYKAFIFLAGPCMICPECAKLNGSACNFSLKARPCMESCGIDVFQTARNNGFPIQPLREMSETQHLHCLMLID